MEVNALKVSEGQWGFVFRKEDGKSLRSRVQRQPWEEKVSGF